VMWQSYSAVKTVSARVLNAGASLFAILEGCSTKYYSSQI